MGTHLGVPEMSRLDFDPLTCDLWRVLQHRFWREDCTCDCDESARHNEICLVTPIYAQMNIEYGLVEFETRRTFRSVLLIKPNWPQP